MLKKYINIPENLWDNIYRTGSNFICDPPVNNTDIDFVLFSKAPSKLLDYLCSKGFEANCRGDYPLEVDGFFVSMKKDKLNLIITDKYDFYIRFVKATDLAKKLNLLEKQQRITLFQYILYDNLYDPAS